MIPFIRHLIAVLFLLITGAHAAGRETSRPIGVARIDFTPDYPIRLSGYAVRKTEATNVVQKLWAKAIAIGSDKEGPALNRSAEHRLGSLLGLNSNWPRLCSALRCGSRARGAAFRGPENSRPERAGMQFCFQTAAPFTSGWVQDPSRISTRRPAQSPHG